MFFNSNYWLFRSSNAFIDKGYDSVARKTTISIPNILYEEKFNFFENLWGDKMRIVDYWLSG